MTAKYRLLEHTADVRVEIYGASFAELLRNAAYCVFDVMIDLAQVRVSEHMTVALTAADEAELLLDWLRELLFLFSTRGFVVGRVGFEEVTTTRLQAVLSGERFDLDRHGLKIELKVPTYHEYSLKQTPAGWQAHVIFDA